MDFKVIVWLSFLLFETQALDLINDNVILQLIDGDDAISISLTLDGNEKFSGEIGRGQHMRILEECEGLSSCRSESDGVVLNINPIDTGFSISWQSDNTETTFEDCLDLDASNTNWYGGPEKWEASFPIENLVYTNRIYTTLKSDNGAVAERYWLNSKGGYVFIGDNVPLYLDQNSDEPGSICFRAAATGAYVNRQEVIFDYNLVALNDPREGHLHAINNYLGKPQSHPDEWIIRNPIWTTWAKYKKDINDEIVVDFATDIANHGYTGQIEIDDYWETCYGSLTFNDNQFPNINNTVQTLKDLGFTVTLWTHPFVNHDCDDPDTYGEDNDYFITNIDGSDITNWWDGDPAHHVDFTKEGARNWFTDRLRRLQDLHGINAFKFDAGESDWAPPYPILNVDVEDSPNGLTAAYVRTCAEFGGLIEVRAGWRTQDLGIFVRMLDKDSRWGIDNGLLSVITSTLQFNLNGYVFVLPDMVGGNGYGELPSAELIVRWAQANTFLPSIQLSFLPWEITSDDFDSAAIVKKFVDLRTSYGDSIMNAVNNAIADGTPVNAPIWWVDPTNSDALKVNDQYLLGEEILVAPVVQEGATSRDIVIPSGSWQDGNDGTIYEGPQILRGYPAPIDVLPYFIKQ